jgi:hypothetical protein
MGRDLEDGGPASVVELETAFTQEKKASMAWRSPGCSKTSATFRLGNDRLL